MLFFLVMALTTTGLIRETVLIVTLSQLNLLSVIVSQKHLNTHMEKVVGV